jgi:uncharacterized Fe-S center protein
MPASRKEDAQAVSRKALTLFLKLGLSEKIKKESFVALKMHFGEKGNTGFIKAPWLEKIVRELKKKTARAFFTDTNTLYVGMRSNAIDYANLAAQHGYSLEEAGLPVFIADGLIGEDEEEIKVGLKHIQSAKIGAGIVHADFLLCLSHLTGHVQTGLGATIKNLGMGCAARTGKLEQHSQVHPRISSKACTNCGICLDYCPAQAIIQKEGSAFIIDDRCIGCGECLVVCKVGAVKMRWDEDSARLQEKIAEYAYAVHSHFQGNIGYLNFLMKMTKDCDCMSKDQPEIVEDIGILASLDPVALDLASAELVVKTAGKDVLRAGYDIDWSLQLKHGVQIGLGSLEYELTELK